MAILMLSLCIKKQRKVKERWVKTTYDKEFKESTLKLSDEIGVKKVAEKL